MKNQQQERNLNNAENSLNQINQVADQLRSKVEFSQELGNIEKIKQMVQDAEQEVKNAKMQNK